MADARPLRAYADAVAALLDAAPPDATEAFDAALDALISSGRLAPDEARLLRWRQRDGLRALRDHAADVLPPTIAALVDSARDAGAALKPVPAVTPAAPEADEGDIAPSERRIRLVAGLRALAAEGSAS